MLKKRIIPCLDLAGGNVVKGVAFESVKPVGIPVERAMAYDAMGADELAVYDIMASIEGRPFDRHTVESIASVLSIPLSVGGGIRNEGDVYDALCAGADKVSLNTAAFLEPTILDCCAKRYGNQCVVLSVDCKLVEGFWQIMLSGGKKTTGVDAIEWIREGVSRGAGEVIVNTVGTDGTCGGYAIEFLKQVRAAVDVPIIASGGAGQIEDFVNLFKGTGVDGALAASVFHYGRIDMGELKEALYSEGIQVRRCVE